MHNTLAAVNAATTASKMTIAAVGQACHRRRTNTYTNPNAKDVTKPKPNSTDPTNPNRLTTNLNLRRNSHFR